MSDVDYPVKGACQCGHVQYELLAPPLLVVACHCKQCQKLSTSAFSLTAVVSEDSVKFSGDMQCWSRVAESGHTNSAKFCPHCGNRIYHFDPDEPGKIKLKPSTLSDTRMIIPTVHVWVSEKQAWYHIPEGVKVFDKQP